MRRFGRRDRSKEAFAISSLLAVGVGCWVAAWHGVGVAVWGRNVAAWVLGAALMFGVRRVLAVRLFSAALLVTPLALVASLAMPGQAGVHRWITLGPLSWNVAFLLLPAASVALAIAGGRGSGWPWVAAIGIELVLRRQPDASQATAFAAAAILILVGMQGARGARLAAGFGFALAAGVSWTRPDPLQPVPEVEGILGLAPWGMAAACVALLGAVGLSPLFAPSAVRRAASYCLVCALMPLFGAFPVPLMGMGVLMAGIRAEDRSRTLRLD